MLQRLQHPQRLVDRPAERQVVDRRVLHDALAVDDEEAAQGDAVRGEHAEGLGELLLEVSDERVGEVAWGEGGGERGGRRRESGEF